MSPSARDVGKPRNGRRRGEPPAILVEKQTPPCVELLRGEPRVLRVPVLWIAQMRGRVGRVHRQIREADAVSVWTVNKIHSPYVSHEFEVIGIFSTQAKATAFGEKCEGDRAEAINNEIGTYAEHLDKDQRHGYGYEVEEWDVDKEWQ